MRVRERHDIPHFNTTNQGPGINMSQQRTLFMVDRYLCLIPSTIFFILNRNYGITVSSSCGVLKHIDFAEVGKRISMQLVII